jgi:hemolysin activation/secretion protein
MPRNRDQSAARTPGPLTRWLGGGIWLLLATFEMVAHAEISMTRTYPVAGYELRGNTVLKADAASNVLANATGPAVPLNRICQTLAALRRAYQERGYVHVRVSLPEQQTTAGIVLIDVEEGDLSADAISIPTAATNTPPPLKFAVHQFVVTGNTLLQPPEIEQILQPATGPAVTLDDIRKVATSLQRAYRERGYATVAVSLPSQRLTNATVRLAVTEGKLASVQIVGNRHFSSENILRNFPDLHTNTLLNSHIFQRELDLANQNRDRQIYPTLGPGPETGTSALVLRVDDRLPLHAHLETDNYATPDTPALRVNFAAQDNNLWQRDQQAGLTYSFTPQEYKTLDNTPNFGFNQPLISSYSAFYRIPFPAVGILDDQVAASPQFGYQEATHQFLLPPAQAASELTFYASASASDTGIKWGTPTVVSRSNLLSIVSRDSEQSDANNDNLGSQFRFPLFTGDRSHLTGFIGVDFKQFGLTGYSTNNFFITTTTTNQYGAQTNQSIAAKGQPAASTTVIYIPVNGGLDFSEMDGQGATAANLSVAGNFAGSDAAFAALAYSSRAQAVFGKTALTVSREEKLPAGYSFFVRAGGQAASGPLINNEQLAVGGLNSVRGYYEGDQYGDCGWSGSVELRSPYWGAQIAALPGYVPAWLRASVFTDCGQRILLAAPDGTEPSLWLLGAGFGLSANLNNHLDARMTIAWPFSTTPNTTRYDMHAYFSIGGQF